MQTTKSTLFCYPSALSNTWKSTNLKLNNMWLSASNEDYMIQCEKYGSCICISCKLITRKTHQTVTKRTCYYISSSTSLM